MENREAAAGFNLRRFREKWPVFCRVSRSEFLAFLECAANRHDPEHSEALELLLQPATGDLAGYYLRMASLCSLYRLRPRQVPIELTKIFCELAAFARAIPEPRRMPGIMSKPAQLRKCEHRQFFDRLLSKAPIPLRRWLFEKRFPLRPFLDYFTGPWLLPGAGRGQSGRRKWRIWRKELARCGTHAGYSRSPLEPTLADLHFLIGRAGQDDFAGAAWKQVRTLLLPAAQGSAESGTAEIPEPVRLPSAGRCGAAFWNRLIDAQAMELAAVAHLAREASRMTRHVVLSWHNATLAAAGGWAFEEFSAALASRSLYGEFTRGVLDRASTLREILDSREAGALFDLRADRLFAPKMAHSLDRHRLRARVRRSSPPPRGLEQARFPTVLRGRAHESGLEWSGALSPHQETHPEKILARYEAERGAWRDGLVLLFALAMQAQEMIDSGTIPWFVLPWIDKFFISSRRKADREYLQRLFRFIGHYIEAPLILFWEDTAHAQSPSFGLALEELRARGLPSRGIGIFDFQGSDRSEAAEIIRRDYPDKSLFALRPISDCHCGDAGSLIFGGRHWGFFRHYDSSWKDNLVFLYSGTQVVPLLSVQTEMECAVPWVSSGHRRRPFGVWFRGRLRRLALPGGGSREDDPLWLAYASWANLI